MEGDIGCVALIVGVGCLIACWLRVGCVVFNINIGCVIQYYCMYWLCDTFGLLLVVGAKGRTTQFGRPAN
jgi:hypothetical protein